MKHYFKMIIAVIVTVGMVACGSDEDSLNPIPVTGLPVVVAFDADELMKENAGTKLITVTFSDEALASGSIALGVVSNSFEGYTTVPALQQGQLIVPVAKGDLNATFMLIIPNNNQVDGERELTFSLLNTSSGFELGDKITKKITILDDDRYGIAKSFETNSGGWTTKKTYEYDESGRISKVHWETNTPISRSGTDTYYYAENGLIARINYYPNNDEFFYQESGRIVRSEKVNNEVVVSITDYDYDDFGAVGAKAVSNRQSSGEYILSLLFVYYNYGDGNLYKQETYIPSTTEGQDYDLISTRTYEHYSTSNVNPFPVEIIPTIKAQINLPLSYRVQENGSDITYSFSYLMGEDGLPDSRTASSSFGNETTNYSYY